MNYTASGLESGARKSQGTSGGASRSNGTSGGASHDQRSNTDADVHHKTDGKTNDAGPSGREGCDVRSDILFPVSDVDGESSSTNVQRKPVVYGRQDDVIHTDRRTNEKSCSRERTNGKPVTHDSNCVELSTAEDRLLLSTKERTHSKQVRFQPNRLKVTMGGGQSYV